MSSGAPTVKRTSAGGAGDGKAALSAGRRLRLRHAAARQFGIFRHPGLRAVDGGASVRDVSCWRSENRQLEFVDYVWRGGFGTAFSFQNTLQRSSPLILTALAVAIPARIGLIMIGGEGALVLGGFAAAAIAVPMVGVVPPIIVDAAHGRDRRRRRRYLGRHRGLSQIRARRQRDHLVAAADLHRHRDHELLRRRRDARREQSQQALNQADRRRLHGRQHSRHGRALGLSASAFCCRSRCTF